MRTLAGVAIGMTAVILWHLLGWPFIGWLFTRIPPNAVGTIRRRRWINGVEVTP